MFAYGTRENKLGDLLQWKNCMEKKKRERKKYYSCNLRTKTLRATDTTMLQIRSSKLLIIFLFIKAKKQSERSYKPLNLGFISLVIVALNRGMCSLSRLYYLTPEVLLEVSE